MALAVGDGWTLHSVRWRSGRAQIRVTAVSPELARSVADLAVDGAVDVLETDDRVEIGFWHLSSQQGALRHARQIVAPRWQDIRSNYAPQAATALDQLAQLDGHRLAGRTLLMHGPAGTGKTTALRSLAREWDSWCHRHQPHRGYPGRAVRFARRHRAHRRPAARPDWRLLPVAVPASAQLPLEQRHAGSGERTVVAR